MKRTIQFSLAFVLASFSLAQTPFWQPLGSLGGGVFSRMWANPAGDLFMSSNFPVHKSDGNGSNLFRSADQGLTWSDMTATLDNQAVWAFAQHPSTGLTVIASQFPRNPLQINVPSNINTSPDNGQSWSPVNNTTFLGNLPVFALTYDAAGTWLYAAQKQTGVRRSSNNGSTWTLINTGLANVNVKDLEKGMGGAVFTCTDSVAGSSGKVFSWSGAAWTDVSTGLPGGSVQDLVYDAAAFTMYASVNGSGTLASKVYKRVNSGSWTQMSGYAGYTIDRLVLDAAGVLHVHANHQGVYRYTGSWSTINNGLDPLWATAGVATSSGMYAATRKGLYKWDVNTNAWVFHHNIRSINTVLSITFGPNGELLAGTLNGIYRSADGGGSWTAVGLSEQLIMAVSYDAFRNQYYTGTNNNTSSELWRSTDGINWSLSNTGFNSLRVLDFAYLPDNRVICGTGWTRPVNFSNDGSSWSGGTVGTMGFSGGTISLGLAVDNAGRIWSSTESLGVYRSDDAVPTHYTYMGFTGGNMPDIRITPQQDVFATHTIFNSPDGLLYRWRNSTSSWVVPNNLLPAGTGLANGVLPTSNKHVYAAMENGCYYTADTGATWTQLVSGLPAGNHTVQTIERGPDGHLYCGLAGGGIFRSVVPAESPYVTLNAKVFLEGPFDGISLMTDALRTLDLLPAIEPYTAASFIHVGDGGGEVVDRAVFSVSGNNAIVDWVLVELRNSAAPGTIVVTKSALVQRDGDVVDLDGVSPLTIAAAPGNYHVAVRHRNHLGAMTANAIALNTAPVVVDFRSTSTLTYGSTAQKQVGSDLVLWSGNILRDGPVSTLKYTGTGNDRDPILLRIGGNAPNNSVAGYFIEDVTLNGTVSYTGSGNDRDPILVNVGSTVPTNTRMEQLP